MGDPNYSHNSVRRIFVQPIRSVGRATGLGRELRGPRCLDHNQYRFHHYHRRSWPLAGQFDYWIGQCCPHALLPSARNLTGQDLGGLTLTPGVYKFDSAAQLTGTLNLDGLGDPNAIFVFQIGYTLTTASGSAVNVIGGENNRVFWEVGSSATLGTGTTFAGSILALASVTMNTGASIPCGRAVSLMDAVTLNSNTISTCSAGVGVPNPGAVGDVPEPGTVWLFCGGLLALTLYAWQSRKRLV